jgi:alginate O-acetyltransferase complex protein AlgI
MSLISLPFLFILPFVWIIFRMVKVTHRWVVLLLFSMLFIGAERPYALLVVLGCSLLTFYAGKFIGKGQQARTLFFFAVILQFAALLLLKYVESADIGLRFQFKETGFRTDSILYTIGFSFYTLQHLGYLIDIRYGRIEPEKNLWHFLLYSAFFAKFNAGPLERAQILLPQFRASEPDKDDLSQGIQRIILGLFKKLVLANRLAPIVERIFSDTPGMGSLASAAGVIVFTIQLYFDFSGYCDLAIGTARLFGIRLTENFSFPLSSTSISVFWRRWHISLISWFTDYIYYPVVFGLRRLGYWAVIAGIICTFLLSGVWHGIGKTFLIWSLLHILYLSYESISKNVRVGWSGRFKGGWYAGVSVLTTFSLVCFSNLFFRATDGAQAKQLIYRLGNAPLGSEGWEKGFLAPLAGGGYQEALFNLFVAIALSFFFLLVEKRVYNRIETGKRSLLQIAILLIFIFILGVFNKVDSFIYLQF